MGNNNLEKPNTSLEKDKNTLTVPNTTSEKINQILTRTNWPSGGIIEIIPLNIGVYKIILKGWEIVLCYLEWDKYKILNIEWEKKFKDFSDLKYNKEWKLVSWIIENENWTCSYFYLDLYEYKFLDLEWKKKIKTVYNLEYNEKWDLIHWMVKKNNWSFFYFEVGWTKSICFKELLYKKK